MVLPYVTSTVILMMLVSTSTEQTLESLTTDVTAKSNEESENCKNIRDYEPCIKNTCAEHMPCYCREKKEYCRCINFKGPLGDYWNLGSNCEQQWNTLDFILVAVLPGVSLVMIVAVCMHCVYSYKKRKYIAKASKRMTDGKELTQSKDRNTNHQNTAFVNDESNDEDLSIQQESMNYPQRISKVNIPCVSEMKYFQDPEVKYIPKANIRSNQPESNVTKEKFSHPMQHTNSSYEADQHLVSPYFPTNNYIQQDYGMPLKRPQIKGIQVLPIIANRPSFKEEYPADYPGNQYFHYHSAYARPQN